MMRLRITWSYFVLALFSVACPATLRGDEAHLKEAVAAYRAALEMTDPLEKTEKFRQAEVLFTQAIRESPRTNADLYANLGNAAFQAQRFGPAIAAYRQALLIDPGHRRARTNLAQVRGRLPAWVQFDNANGLIGSLFFWYELWTPAAIGTLAAAAFLLSTSLYAASIRWRLPVLRNLALLPLVLWLVLLISLVLPGWIDRGDQAVVIADEVTARSADAATASPRFTNPLPSGTEARVMERRENWTQISVANDQTAWVPTSSLQFFGE